MTADTTAACRSCGDPIRWVRTHGGKLMPMDPQPVDRGNIILTGRERVGATTSETVPEVLYLNPDQPTLDGRDRYVSHFATCPDRDEWRRT